MPKVTTIARFTGNHQVSIPKTVRKAVGQVLGDFVELTAEHGIFFGVVVGLEREFGYFGSEELEGIRGPGGLPIC